jgi:hypothetical protein
MRESTRDRAIKPWRQLELDENTEKLWEAVRPRRMTSIQRLDALRQGIEYIRSNAIHGDYEASL